MEAENLQSRGVGAVEVPLGLVDGRSVEVLVERPDPLALNRRTLAKPVGGLQRHRLLALGCRKHDRHRLRAVGTGNQRHVRASLSTRLSLGLIAGGRLGHLLDGRAVVAVVVLLLLLPAVGGRGEGVEAGMTLANHGLSLPIMPSSFAVR